MNFKKNKRHTTKRTSSATKHAKRTSRLRRPQQTLLQTTSSKLLVGDLSLLPSANDQAPRRLLAWRIGGIVQPVPITKLTRLKYSYTSSNSKSPSSADPDHWRRGSWTLCIRLWYRRLSSVWRSPILPCLAIASFRLREHFAFFAGCACERFGCWGWL